MLDPILMSFVNILFAKWLPPSLMIVLGVPNLIKIFFCKKLTTVLVSFLGQATASTHLEHNPLLAVYTGFQMIVERVP